MFTTKSDKTAAKIAAKTEKSENLKRRAERFGIPTKENGSSSSTAKAAVNGNPEQAKKLKSRADRFGNSDGKKISGESSLGEAGGDDKKAARAARFTAMTQ